MFFREGTQSFRTDIPMIVVDSTREDTQSPAGEISSPGDQDSTNSSTRKLAAWLSAQTNLSESGARQLADYFIGAYKVLGAIPSQKKLILERFFDESGGMQLVLHSVFGIRVNRAWGLALRKRFCRSFNFELQAAATDDAIVLSLGTQHSFPLEEVFRYLHSNTVRDLLVQALLDAPMFPIRWRWNATRALALPRQRGGRKVPAPLQRMESENLLAAVFPDQLACLENIAGDREVPDHPLVKQTIEDCLTEAMDIDGLIGVLKKIENEEIECIARDLPEPSPLAHEILNAKPYAFLDNAPLEERRTQAVYTRRAGESSANNGLGILDAAAIEKVCEDAFPRATNPDELHEALLLAGVLTNDEISRIVHGQLNGDIADGHGSSRTWLELLTQEKRAGWLTGPPSFWIAAERVPMLEAVYPDRPTEPPLIAPSYSAREWSREDAMRELVRGRLELSGPITIPSLATFLNLKPSEIESALVALEGEGFVLRGKFRPNTTDLEWCERRLLSRIHRLTINRLRAEIQPVSIADFQRFLVVWQTVDPDHRLEGPEGAESVLRVLDGCEIPAAAWEPEILALRIKDYTPQWLDQLCFTGRIGWGRLSPPQSSSARPFAPVRSSPISIFRRENLPHWLVLSPAPGSVENSLDTQFVLQTLSASGASFFSELVQKTRLLPSRAEQALAELVTQGLVTSDSFEGLRALLVPSEKRIPFADVERRRRHRSVTSVEFAGRWYLLRSIGAQPDPAERDAALETFARVLLRRYGVVFRRMLERESFSTSWYDLGRIYRRMEAEGEIRGGYFVSGVSGEQFALPEAIGLLRSLRKNPTKGKMIVISGADPLNLVGILSPGPRVSVLTANRLLLRDGMPIAALEAGQIRLLDPSAAEDSLTVERHLRLGTLPAALRPYYA